MITNYDEQVQLIELVIGILSQISDEIPHLESVTEARGYINGATTSLRFISEKMLPPDLFKEINRYIDSEIKGFNTMIDDLGKKGLL